MDRISRFLYHGIHGNAVTVDIGLTILRVIAGLAFALVFEKVLPRDGIWGPQEWFVNDVASMGFPFPVFFAWAAALSEFFGGILLIVGFLTRPAAFLNICVTLVAAFLYHGGDLADSGLTAFVFLAITTTLLLAGPGKFSLDGIIARRLSSPHEQKDA